MRSSACDTLARSCARWVLCWPAFPLVSVLGSTGSAADRSALFVGFPATTTEADFSGSCITGYDSSSSRCGPAVSSRRSNPRPPDSRAKSFHTCQGLRPRRVGRALAIMPASMLPSAFMSTSAPGTILFSRLNGWPMRSPADASPTSDGCQCTGRGRCGALLLHRSGLAPPTLCRFRPAHQKSKLLERSGQAVAELGWQIDRQTGQFTRGRSLRRFMPARKQGRGQKEPRPPGKPRSWRGHSLWVPRRAAR